MYPRSVHALQADALFASALQRSDELTVSQIRRAITAALDGYGVTGCAGRVAQEFGDHPETAVERMRWARVVAGEVFTSPPGPAQDRARRQPGLPVAGRPRLRQVRT